MNKSAKSFKKWRIIIGLAVFLLLIIAALPAYLFFLNIKYKYKEKIIDREFHQEVQKLPEIKVKKFKLWEGDSMAELEIANKGTVNIWYGVSKIPQIVTINDFFTSFDCFYVDNNGNKKNYAYTLDLSLEPQSMFSRWFPFQVNSLGDLVNKYEDIINILKTFPQNPPMVNLSDPSGNRKILKSSNPNFEIKTVDRNKPVSCDLYFSTI